MRRLGLAPFLCALLLGGCFQSECPDVKGRMLDRFNPASPTFDAELLSPGSQNDEGIQARLDGDPARCVDLSDEFRQSAIDGVEGEICGAGEIGTPCSGGGVCHRATESTLLAEVFECRQACSGVDDESCPVGTACINLDDDDDGSLDGFRCDNPNLGACQAILRELSEARCVECDEMELLICECRSGPSLFQCLSAFVTLDDARIVIANEVCAEETGATQGEDFNDCVVDFSEANTREERRACIGVQLNIARNDDDTPDCDRYGFQQDNGLVCGDELECIGGRCVFIESREFDDQGQPLDPVGTRVCSSDCARLDDPTGTQPDLGRCVAGEFCSDNLTDLDGNVVAPACVSLGDPNLAFSDDFSTLCDLADPNSCGPGVCAIIPIPGQGDQPRCTWKCDEASAANCGFGNVCTPDGFCAP